MAIKCQSCHADNPETVKFCGGCGTKLNSLTPWLSPGQPTGPAARASFTKTLETSTDELTRGAVFAGRYEIIEELGAGGMGRVYRAHDTKLNEEVALKLIRPEFGADKRTVERFHNEIKLARKIRHKNVCGTHDLHEEGRTLYLTMEYVRGEDLKSFIRRSKVLSVSTAVAIARQVAEGLAEAHKLGIIHRDLKPGNVMIDKDGQAKIMDFGIARAMREKGITGAGAIVGTPEYMSPEQVEGKDADQRSDIYALGVILFEMVTGQAPFEGETPLSIAHKHRYQPPPDPQSLNPQIPADVGGLILRCMEKPLEKRYQTTSELLADLTTIEEAFPTAERVSARPTPAKRRPTTSKKLTIEIPPRRLSIPVASVLLLAIAGFIAWRMIKPRPEQSASSLATPYNLAVLDFSNLSEDQGLGAWTKALPGLLAQSLSASRYIHVVPQDQTVGILNDLGLTETERLSTKDLRKVAKAAKATHLVAGNLMKDGPKIILAVNVFETKASRTASPMRIEVNDAGEISSKINVLSRQVKLDLGLMPNMINSDFDVEGMGITTPYPQALNAFFEALGFIRKVEYARAISAMERAVAIDPEFAMAYRYLSALSGNLGRQVDMQKHMAKALELAERGRLSLREKLHIYARKAVLDGDSAKASGLYEELLRLDALDVLARNMLGREYLSQGKYELGLEQYEILIKNGLDDPLFVGNLLAACLSAGAYDKAKELRDRYHSSLMESPRRGILGLVSLVLGDFDQALVEADAIGKYEPVSHVFKGEALLLKGDFAGAEAEFKLALAEPGEGQVNGSSHLYYLAKARGRFADAEKECRQALEISNAKGQGQDGTLNDYIYLGHDARHIQAALQEVSQAERGWLKGDKAHWYRAWLFTMAGDLGRAQEEAQDLKRILEKEIERSANRNRIASYEHIMGRIALAKNDLPDAISHLKAAVALIPGQSGNRIDELNLALYVEPLARVYYESGDILSARQSYEKIISLTRGRIRWGEIYALAFYNLGKIAEKQGDTGRARDEYQKFLELWKDADPGLPEVEDARKRLAGLKGN